MTQKQQNIVEYLPRNEHGRDFIVGDIHGMFTTLDELLKKIEFNEEKDRLISVGDLIDRGKESTRSLEFLEKSWFYCIRGNHECMLLDSFNDLQTLKNWTEYNGGSWWNKTTLGIQTKIREAFSQLPFAIELETSVGKIGVVHAGVSQRTSWSSFVDQLHTDKKIRDYAVWTRAHYDRYQAIGAADSVSGVKFVVVGHTPIKDPMEAGNILYIDTGAVYNTRDLGKLTALQVEPEIAYFSHHAFEKPNNTKKKKKHWLFG